MAKNEINANFENLKAEMMKKKNVVKNMIEGEDVKKNENEIKFIDVNVNKNVNIINDIDTDATILSNKIVIKKAAKVQPPKRITYYLNHDTIKKIEKYSKLTGMGKSELVQTLLDISLDNLEVQS
ncbi:hypothetical protein [Romboutsia sp.]|uniref:hypothetical protein n=1 Tax=Romboutsia sp. TaxID=1965302 RepID=UPI003F2ECF1E